jgi:nickel/cobalt exporter
VNVPPTRRVSAPVDRVSANPLPVRFGRPATPGRRFRALTSLALAASAAAALAVLSAAPAQAHPLGNFTINHYDGLSLFPARVEDAAVVDRAEIPTLQDHDTIDTDHDGVLEPAELDASARTQCAAAAAAVEVAVDGSPLHWTVNRSSLELLPGAAGLSTSRLSCGLTAVARLDRPARLSIADRFGSDHIGWREITATGDGVHIDHSPVPAHSVSGELRHYPNDLLSSPLDVRSAVFDVVPGAGPGAGGVLMLPTAGLADRILGGVTGTFNDLVGTRHLTFGVGALAVLLSLILGASHAALPGHGKTVMAAYLAGKHGTTRDAITVGATVTFTHTAGVLGLGLLLSTSASLAGESILNWLGAASGLLIAAIGVSLLRNARRSLRCGRAPEHRDGYDQAHAHGHGYGHEHKHDGGLPVDHRHYQHPSNDRRNLIGMGIAGGLVPSPSALVVLLGTVALGRTAFGIVLVLGYGVGMAATLTAAGLIVVRLSERTKHTMGRNPGRARLLAYVPVVTALLVLTVGVGLAVRSLTHLI